MKIFITGASGFIGDHLSKKLADGGHQVHALVRNELPARQRHPDIRYFMGDITQPKTIQKAIAGCEQAYHVAGYAKLWAARRRTFYDINVTGTENVFQAAFENGVKKVVYTSSCAVFGPSLNTAITESDPRITAFNNDYDLSKFLAESSVREFCKKGIEGVIVNPSRVYGPGLATHANMITKMLTQCLRGKFVFMPGIKNVIGNYAYIDDVVQGHINAMEIGKCGERYIVGGENLSYDQVIKIIREEIASARLVPLPAFAVKAWGYVELLKHKLTGADPKFTPAAATRYLQNAAFDCSKAINEIGYSITGFREGISKTIHHIKTHP
ncbi:NAD-dependent epimerase/dehydratase family protein [Flavitalea antarctica]